MEKLTKKQRMDAQILTHGLNLKRIFNIKDMGPVTLCKKVHRLENKAHRMAEDYCNGVVTEEFQDRQEGSIMKSLDRVLNYTKQGVPVFFNGDPRGYALKIEDDYVREHNLEIHRDWGGYGIIAPEFDGSR